MSKFYSDDCFSFHYDLEAGVCYRTLGFLGLPNNRVGTDGSVWSYRGLVSRGHPRVWKKINGKNPSHNKGYVLYNFTKMSHFGHRLVLLAFVGPCPVNMETRHLNGVRHDNHLENLAWGTLSENQRDRIKHGTTNRGDRSVLSKLTEQEVRWIRSIYVPDEWKSRRSFCVKYAKLLGVSLCTLKCALVGTWWKHVK